MISHFFIDRPIFACVVCLVITLLGAVSMQGLPIEQFPNIVPPTVSVSATYPGASAEDVANAVAIPLEQQINGVDNMMYMATQCTSDGSLSITISFEVGTDPDIASVLVQNRVKIAEPLLPEEVRRQGIRVDKRSTSFVLFLNINEKDDSVVQDAGHEKTKTYAEYWSHLGKRMFSKFTGGVFDKKETRGPDKTEAGEATQEPDAHAGGMSGALARAMEQQPHGTKSGPYLANYASLYVKDRLARVKGVGQVMMFDNRDFSMRIWLDEDAMAARGISVQEVNRAIAAQNVQVSAGRIGVSPVPEGIQSNLAIVTLGRLEDVGQFENMILRVDSDGGILRLKDVAIIELGAANYTMECRFNGRTATGMAVSQRAGANALQVAKDCIKTMEDLKDSLGRSGLQYDVAFNATSFIQATVDEFYETLFLCVLFVVATVYIFLQDWRAALIPTLTIPVSIVGTFFLMKIFGFSINTMTLFGLILVIGIVVDDAIVVVENTQRIIDEEHLEPHAAAKKSMIEVLGPVIATVLVMMAIFLPTAMMEGIIGQLYKQFALTIAGAVAISGICGITLAPALCGILLRPSIPKNKKFIGFRIFNYFFDGFANFYLATVKGMIFVAPLILLLWIGLIFVLIQGMKFLPSGFLPDEDQGVAFVDVRLPEGATQERTGKVLNELEEILEKHQHELGVKHRMLVSGFSFIAGSGSNLALIILPLESWHDRETPELQKDAIVEKMKALFDKIPDAQIQIFTPPPIMGLGMTNGITYELLDERDAGPNALAQVLEDVKIKATAPTPGDKIPIGTIMMGITAFNPNAPRLYLDIDRDKAQKMGIPLGEIFAALQTNIGSAYINDFNKFGRTFRVYVQAQGQYRDNVNDVLDMKVKNNAGGMVPLGSFVTMQEISGPQLLTRYNMFPSASFMGVPRFDKSTGQAMQKMEEVSQTLPDGFTYEWTGISLQEKRVGSQTAIIFALSVLFAFLVLAAQYESWSTPLIIMMAVPLGVFGALLSVVLFALFGGHKLEVNMYTQIGLIMMVGLSAKNAILITEFAREKRAHGTPLVQAAYEAGRLRLRPIMMTSFAFILGVVPLVIATGAGANSRNAIGNCVFGGLLTETMVGVYVSPVLFVIMQGFAEWCEKHINDALTYSRNKAKRHAEIEEVNLRQGD